MTKYFFATYCVSSNPGPAMIGVYKRGLRIALELTRRGHEVIFYCSGRENYQDDLTMHAQGQMEFVDIPWSFDPAKRRDDHLKVLNRCNPETIVIGEAPLSGPLLETTLCAAELRIPTVCLDNAYQPLFNKVFCFHHSGMFDQIILNGLSSQYELNPREYLKQVPPFVTPYPNYANTHESYILVLAYDYKVAELAFAILDSLPKLNFKAIFIGSEKTISPILNRLPREHIDSCNIIPPPSEDVYFSLLERAQVAITKFGFMQVTEALSLKTPIIALYYPGYFLLESLPKLAREFIFVVENPNDPSAISAFSKFMEIESNSLAILHNGSFNGMCKAADCLEEQIVFSDKTSHISEAGFNFGLLEKAVSNLENQQIAIEMIRGFYLRGLPTQVIYSIVCHYRKDEQHKVVRMLGHQYKSIKNLEADLKTGQNRKILVKSFRLKRLIELDQGKLDMPTFQDCFEMGEVFIPKMGKLNKLINEKIKSFIKI